MFKASETDNNTIIKELTASELGIMLLEADKPSAISTIAPLFEFTRSWREMRNDAGETIKYCIYHVSYNELPSFCPNDPMKTTKTRNDAIKNIYGRWAIAKHETHFEDNPITSQKFLAYLNDIEFFEADYIIFEFSNDKIKSI